VRAAVYHGRGDVRVEDVPAPAAPEPGAVRLEVLRGAICGSDSTEYAHGPKLISLAAPHPGSGHQGPVVLGHEFVGRVSELGAGVGGLAIGDRVVSGAGVSCGECAWCRAGRTNLCARYYTLGFQRDGGLAEEVVSPAQICVKVPDGCGDDAAAMAQPLAVALHGLNRAAAAADEPLAVIGVGGIGAFIVAAAVARGNREVLAVDVDEARLRTAAALGAAEAIDASASDPVAAVREITAGEGAAVAIDAAGVPGTLNQAVAMTRQGGRVLMLGLPAKPVELDSVAAILREVDLFSTVAHVCGTDLPEALRMLAETAIAERVVEGVIELGRIVPDGLVPLADGSAKGKILVDVNA
jgi:(R,R)-butanediol dehydrogenase / meso-butanediol dehydrogenase / diacetyl reductase